MFFEAHTLAKQQWFCLNCWLQSLASLCVSVPAHFIHLQLRLGFYVNRTLEMAQTLEKSCPLWHVLQIMLAADTFPARHLHRNWSEYYHVISWESNCDTFILKCLYLLSIFFFLFCSQVLQHATLAWPWSSNRSPDKDVATWIPLCVSHSSVPRQKNLWVNA